MRTGMNAQKPIPVMCEMYILHCRYFLSAVELFKHYWHIDYIHADVATLAH